MYRKILLAYDGSAFSAVALRQSAELARQGNARLHLLAVVVVNSGTAVAEGFGGQDVWGDDQKRLRQVLNTAAQDLREQGVVVSTSIRFGNPGLEVANAAHELNADLVVIGHSDKGILIRWLLGSVGAELLDNLPCSLLVVTGKA